MAQSGTFEPRASQQAQLAQQEPFQLGSFGFRMKNVGPSGPSGPSQAPAGMPPFMSEVFMPARARAVALRQQHEMQAGLLQRQQPLGVSSNIARSVREKTAAQQATLQEGFGTADTATGPQVASSSSRQMPAPAPIKAQVPANPKAKIMEEVRAAELARAIAPEPKVAAAVAVDAAPSTLAFHGSAANKGAGQMQQDKPLTAANFKALARQLSGEKTVQDALAVEASLSFGQLPQPGAATGRRQAATPPETIAEAEPLDTPETTATQQPAVQSPFAKHRRFTPSMTADDMAAMAMGAIDRIRGRAEQSDDEISVRSEPTGTVRSKSMPREGSTEDLSSLALAAIARLRNLADQAKEPSPRSSSAPRPCRPSVFESSARRPQLPEGPSPFQPQHTKARSASKPGRPDRLAEARQSQEPVPVSAARFQDVSEVTPVKAQQAQQAAPSTPDAAPATPALPTPAAAQQATPPSRPPSPEATPMPDIVSAADVAAQQPQQQATSRYSKMVASPVRNLPQPTAAAEPADRQQQPEQFETALQAEHAEPAVVPPSTPGVSPEGSPVAQGESEAGQPRQTEQLDEAVAPPSPSASSYTSSRGNEQDDEPFEFDEAAAAAKAKEKGKAIISTADFRPVSVPYMLTCQYTVMTGGILHVAISMHVNVA